MHIEKDNNKCTARLNVDELRVLHQSLNEVCNGFLIEDFERKVGGKDEVKKVMEKVRRVIDSQKAEQDERCTSLTLSLEQLVICRNVLHETCGEIEEWEFPSRVVGLPKSFAERLRKEFDDAIQNK